MLNILGNMLRLIFCFRPGLILCFRPGPILCLCLICFDKSLVLLVRGGLRRFVLIKKQLFDKTPHVF